MNDPDPRTANLVKECRRQFDNCLYSAAALFTWQKHARLWRGFFLIAPIVLGGFASSQLLLQEVGPAGKLTGALCGVLAGIFPSIFKALNLDVYLEGVHRSATEFTNLRDRFRRAASVTSLGEFDEFRAEFEALMDRMDAARATAASAPDWCFRRAQRKIAAGDYDYDVDAGEPARPERLRS